MQQALPKLPIEEYIEKQNREAAASTLTLESVESQMQRIFLRPNRAAFATGSGACIVREE